MEGSSEFAGPLYPPDAAPQYTPSKDSPLVVAVKRATAHCGFWTWDPPSWDDSYSNRFAHEGVAAMQRWSNTIQPTGFFGTKSYNFYRSVLIPQGRTHAGEPAWDQVCVNLAAQAYDLAHPPKPKTTLRQAALNTAVTQLGIKESPPESNVVKYTDWYGMVGPWCAMFCTWCYEQAGDSPSFSPSQAHYAYVPYIVDDARACRNGLSITSDPLPGDLVCYNWGGSAGADAYYYDHVGLFERQDGPRFYAIEGNTSTSNNSNGGEVMRRSRSTAEQGTVFVRVREP